MAKIPIPENFPIKWKKAEDEEKFWLPEIMHAPFPVTPASEYTGAKIVSGGFIRALDMYALPMSFELQVFNYYQYVTVTPKNIPPDKMNETIQIAEENSERAIIEFSEKWKNQWRPEIISLNEKIESVPYQQYTDDELGKHFNNVLAWAKRLWDLHGELAVPMLLAPTAFLEMHSQLFPSKNKLEAMKLLEGLDCETVVTGLQIWQLNKEISAQPKLVEIFLNNDPHTILNKLSQIQEGKKIKKSIDVFLSVYGKRNENFMELNSPTWIEDPTPLIRILQSHLSNPEHDFELVHKKKKNIQEKYLAESIQKLKNRPKAVQQTFERLLIAAQTAMILQEDHNYLLDARVVYVMRHVLQEISKRMIQAKLINKEDDVYYLYVEEIIPVLCGKKNLQETINQRKLELEHFRNIERPQALGTECKVTMPDTLFNRALGRFFGGLPPESMEKEVLLGNSASPGKVEGKVLMANNVEEALNLKKGDILVATTTAPSWTPLFATAAGVVTESGGILCHCAIVAREYDIPAVVGVPRATALLKTGMKIELDGDQGKVKIVEKYGR